ncbi:alpha-ketoacid dehydrogenase subunit beta [Streptomyces cacaoi]|uniref:alpha-ketoacid dehydrogenase subunit beta n=1 Tax=Streptomyces cacaoi TaxID=1898 RepID=UPI003748473B
MRVVENLNAALHGAFAEHPGLTLLGEDVVDPYGGAFKATKGLSSRFPDRVLATPLSEGGIVGVGAGLALAGAPAMVEIMFADFVTLAFDQIVNFAAKSVSMYGSHVPMPLTVRCPTGGGRGYGPTHSQSPQKHFVGVPGLSLYELSPLHDSAGLLRRVLDAKEPAIVFEDKVLYTQRMLDDGTGSGEVDDLFSFDRPAPDVARVYAEDPSTADCVVIAPGGVAHRAIAAARSLLLEEEITCQVLVPTRLHPFDVAPLLPALRSAAAVVVAEESTAGGTWGAEVAHRLHRELWGTLRGPVALAHSADSIIPTAPHLEADVLLSTEDVHRTALEAVRG